MSRALPPVLNRCRIFGLDLKNRSFDSINRQGLCYASYRAGFDQSFWKCLILIHLEQPSG